MSDFIVHIERKHVGWRTTTEEGDTFAEAAVKAAARVHDQYGGSSHLYDVAFESRELSERDLVRERFPDAETTYHYAVFRWAEPHEIFDPLLLGGWGMSKVGDVNFSERVREGKPDDCLRCGGTGIDFYGISKPCSHCLPEADDAR